MPLFARLSSRAGITNQQISPSMVRDTFAIRYLQTGGDLLVLQDLLGLQDPVSVKRYRMDYVDSTHISRALARKPSSSSSNRPIS